MTDFFIGFGFGTVLFFVGFFLFYLISHRGTRQ